MLSFVLQFQFVNSYLSLFYIGFYLKDMERLKEVSCGSPNGSPVRLGSGARLSYHGFLLFNNPPPPPISFLLF